MQFDWRPGIGDPTMLGWLTVVCYLLAAVSSYAVAQTLAGSAHAVPRREILVWRALAVLFLLLGINKQLDLQSAFTEIGRYLAHRQGWYEQRKTMQLLFVGGVAIAGALVVAASIVLLRDVSYQTRIALLGGCLVLIFVVIRAASFHHVDVFLSTRLATVRWNAILEIGGLLFVLLGAWLRTAAGRKQTPT